MTQIPRASADFPGSSDAPSHTSLFGGAVRDGNEDREDMDDELIIAKMTEMKMVTNRATLLAVSSHRLRYFALLPKSE